MTLPLTMPLICGVALVATQARAEEPATGEVEFFERKIRPVLVEHCFECHGADVEKPGGGLRLHDRASVLRGGSIGPALVAGQPDQSLLLNALRYESLEMPPTGRLPDSVIADFQRWIERGAADPRTGNEAPVAGDAAASTRGMNDEPLWSLLPLVPPVVPEADGGWADSDLDRFIAQRHREAGAVPVEDAAPDVLLRRVYFDLVGLPPSADEIREFQTTAVDPATSRIRLDQFAAVVDRLLASPRFGERWGRHWLDLARYAESNGSDRNVVFNHAWRYRDYVIASFNSDKPFDRFVREQLAGDLLPAEDWRLRDEQLIATGFLAIGPRLLGEGSKELFQMNVIDEQIDVVSRVFLGLTVSCARCHDHKFDPVPTRDYYALAGIFGSSDLLYGPMTPANEFGFDRPLQPIGEHGVELDGPAQEYRGKVAEATSVRNKARSDRYRVVRKKAALENEKKAASAERAGQIDVEIPLLDAEIAEWDEKIKLLDADLKTLTDAPPQFPDYCMAVRDQETSSDQAIRLRGDVTQKGDAVPRGVPLVLDAVFAESAPGSPAPGSAAPGSSNPVTGSGRRELADWMVSDRNPLTPRVAANRIWQKLFGTGLVKTVDNFGRNGERPSHPELLDWLALRLRSNGWSTKQLIRDIVLSRTYRLASDGSEGNEAIDPANILLWRSNIRRMEAEVLRDAMLLVSGELVLDPLQGSVVATIEEREFNDRVQLTAEQLESKHRSVYLPVVRYQLPEIFREFDFADPSLVTGTRDQRMMAPQALYLMNSPFVVQRAERIARDALTGESGLDGDADADNGSDHATSAGAADPEAVGRRLIRRVLLREAFPDELTRMTGFVREIQGDVGEPTAESVQAAWTAVAQTLLMTAEFRYVP